ncbi:MAG: hypothetical protein VB021_03315 [Oscillospiraceae bacterium]|nr:hypothetical protein [Oscillospiraceae bacterium]
MLLAVLAACGAAARGEAAPDIFRPPFTLSADYTCGSLEGALSLARPAAQRLELTFTSPADLAGLCAVLDGDAASLSFAGMTDQRGAGELPRDHPARALAALFLQADAAGGAAQALKNGDVLYTFADGASVTAYAGVPKSIDIPAADLHLTVTGFDAGE